MCDGHLNAKEERRLMDDCDRWARRAERAEARTSKRTPASMDLREAWGLVFSGRTHQKANFPLGHPGKFVGHVPSEKYDAALDAILANLPAVLGAVEFYADPKHWDSVRITPGDGYPAEFESGPAWDRGERARKALGIDGLGEGDG